MRDFFEYVSEFPYRKILIDKKWTCRYGDALHLRDEVSYEGDLLLFIDEVHLGSEEIEIKVQYTIWVRVVRHIFIYLVFILDTSNFLYNSISKSWLYIVSDIAGEIRKFPYFLEVSRGDGIFIFPEVRVLVDMNELGSELYVSPSNCLIPEIESVVMIVEDGNSWFMRKFIKLELYEISNSRTWLQNTIF